MAKDSQPEQRKEGGEFEMDPGKLGTLTAEPEEVTGTLSGSSDYTKQPKGPDPGLQAP